MINEHENILQNSASIRTYPSTSPENTPESSGLTDVCPEEERRIEEPVPAALSGHFVSSHSSGPPSSLPGERMSRVTPFRHHVGLF